MHFLLKEFEMICLNIVVRKYFQVMYNESNGLWRFFLEKSLFVSLKTAQDPNQYDCEQQNNLSTSMELLEEHTQSPI